MVVQDSFWPLSGSRRGTLAILRTPACHLVPGIAVLVYPSPESLWFRPAAAGSVGCFFWPDGIDAAPTELIACFRPVTIKILLLRSVPAPKPCASLNCDNDSPKTNQCTFGFQSRIPCNSSTRRFFKMWRREIHRDGLPVGGFSGQNESSRSQRRE